MLLRHTTHHRLARAIGCALLLGGACGLAMPAVAASHAGHDKHQAQTSTGTHPDKSKSTDQHEKNHNVSELGQVVVTAQSRKQAVEDVPIAIQVVNAAQIRDHAATDISKMDIFVPGLVVHAGQVTQPSYQIRGIGDNGFGIGFGPSVGVYVDGVYTAGSGAALVAFNDVKRIEVLKGPQGTLFGRSAAAGAISVITNKPSNKFEARVDARVGNYGERYGDVLLNIPATENSAFRLNVVDNQSRGWMRDAATGEHYHDHDDWGSRLSWRWNAGANTQLLLDWEHERLNQAPEPAIGLIPLSDNTNQRAPYPPDPSTYLNPLHAPVFNDAMGGRETRRYDNITMHIYHYMDWGKFTSISNYRHFKTYNRIDWDGTNHVVDYLDSLNQESNHALYQEFKLQGNTDLADWLVGASWYKDNGYQTSQVRLLTDALDSLYLNLGVPTGTPDGTVYHYFNAVLQGYGLPYSLLGDTWTEEINNHLNYTSTAVYGDVIWHLGDHIDLTTGARFTRDSKDFSWFNPQRIAPELDQTIDALNQMGLLAAAGVSPAAFRQNVVFADAIGQHVKTRNSSTDFSPRVVLADHFTDNFMGYLSIAKGYKAGGYDSVQVGSRLGPETVWNYEAGIKSRFPAQHLLVNASVYHYRYSNLQALTLNTNTSSGIPTYSAETSDEKARGADFEVQWHPVDGLLLHVSAAYIDSRYGHKVANNDTDISGQPTGIPKYSFAGGLQYGWPLAGGTARFNLTQAYRSEGRCNRNSRVQGTCQVSPNFTVNAARNRTDARLGWTSPAQHWNVAVYVNNLFDHQYITGVSNVSASILGTPFADITAPRLYGLELRWKY